MHTVSSRSSGIQKEEFFFFFVYRLESWISHLCSLSTRQESEITLCSGRILLSRSILHFGWNYIEVEISEYTRCLWVMKRSWKLHSGSLIIVWHPFYLIQMQFSIVLSRNLAAFMAFKNLNSQFSYLYIFFHCLSVHVSKSSTFNIFVSSLTLISYYWLIIPYRWLTYQISACNLVLSTILDFQPPICHYQLNIVLAIWSNHSFFVLSSFCLCSIIPLVIRIWSIVCIS